MTLACELEDTACSGLRSTAHDDLHVTRSETNVDDCAIAVAGPASGNVTVYQQTVR